MPSSLNGMIRLLHRRPHSPDVERLIKGAEEAMDDDAESIITNERYTLLLIINGQSMSGKNRQKLELMSDKIDHIVTKSSLADPSHLFCRGHVDCRAYIGVSGYHRGTRATDWANDGVFGKDGSFTGNRNTCAGRRIPTAVGCKGLAVQPDPGQVLLFTCWRRAGPNPQMLVLLHLLAFLRPVVTWPGCIHHDRFSKFGLHGKSFIPMLIGTASVSPASSWQAAPLK